MLLFMCCMYLICCILWTIFSVKMQKILYKNKNIIQVVLFNSLLCPIAMLFACLAGIEIIRGRIEIEDAVKEGRLQELAQEWIKNLNKK